MHANNLKLHDKLKIVLVFRQLQAQTARQRAQRARQAEGLDIRDSEHSEQDLRTSKSLDFSDLLDLKTLYYRSPDYWPKMLM